MTPSPLTPAEMHTAALSVLERVELVARGQAPDLRGITGALDAALALHREIAHALDDVDLDPDGEDVHELRETLARVGETLEIVIRTIDLLAMVRGAIGGVACPVAGCTAQGSAGGSDAGDPPSGADPTRGAGASGAVRPTGGARG